MFHEEASAAACEEKQNVPKRDFKPQLAGIAVTTLSRSLAFVYKRHARLLETGFLKNSRNGQVKKNTSINHCSLPTLV